MRKHYANRTFGGGNAKNRRGKGNKGGKGRAGFHKHKWLQTIVRGEHKNRKYGFHSARTHSQTVTLDQLNRMIATAAPEAKELVLKNMRVVAKGRISAAMTIKAEGFSAGARKAIESAGGKAIALHIQKKKAEGKGKMPKAAKADAPAAKA